MESMHFTRHLCIVAFMMLATTSMPCLAQAHAPGNSHKKSTWEAGRTSFCINYSLTPEAEGLQQYDLCIVDVAAQVDLSRLKDSGCEVLAYASLVEVRPGTPEAEAAARLGIPVVARNDAWKSAVLDVTHPAWPRWVLDHLAQPAWTRGFDGLFLDTLDSIELLGKRLPGEKATAKAALISVIKQLHERQPDRKLLMNRGFALLDQVSAYADGVLIESVFQTWEGREQKYRAVTESDTQWLLDHAMNVKRHGLPVLVVDYVSPENTNLASETIQRIQALDCIPYIATPDLQTIVHKQTSSARWILHEGTCR